MNGWLLDQEIDLEQPVSRQYTSPYGIALTGDDRAQRLRYTVYDGQNAADISGTVKVYYRRPDDTLIESTSGGDYVTVEDNTITAELPPEAYEQKGNVECLVKLYATDGKIVTLARCDIEVRRGVENDETIIPAGEASRASLEDRVAAIEAATGVVPIDQLPTTPHTPTTGDNMVIDDGNGPYKIDYNALADAIIARAAANDLTTTAAGKVLDARQGPALKALIDAVQAALNLSILVGSTTTIAAGTSTVSLTGLTASHRVAFWGFSSGGENDPPADITVTTAADSYTVAVSNVSSSGVTMTPVFIKPQN